MSGGIASRRQEGTPQGGPLSPLLSNILLNELDRELERRGHRFVRYAFRHSGRQGPPRSVGVSPIFC
jgi:hypothetical protein